MKPLLCLLLLFPFGLRAKTITALGGTNTAVQSAIDSAVDGDTVLIPAGTFSWSSGIQLKKPIQLFGAGEATVLNASGSATLVTLTPSNNGNVEFGKVKFTRTANGAPFVYAANAPGKPMLMHDIRFEGRVPGNRCVEWGVNGGVIWNCTFIAMDKADSNGIGFKNPGSDSAWHEVDYMGKDDVNGDKNTYLEDCIFKDLFLQCIDFDDNSRSVMRHCVFDNSAVGSHGQETSSVGARQWELYENKFIFTTGSNNPGPQEYPLNINYWLFIRGGGPGACFNNEMPNITSSAWGDKVEIKFNLYNIRRLGQVPCQKLPPPAAHQIGWGVNASGAMIQSPVYFWGNSGGANYGNPALEDYSPDECGNGLHTSQFVRAGKEYFTDTPKPNYTPYTYPHPLRGGAQPTPTPSATPTPSPSPTATPPPPTPTPTPKPTPTPTPSPSPSPTPGAPTYQQWQDKQAEWIKNNPPIADP